MENTKPAQDSLEEAKVKAALAKERMISGPAAKSAITQVVEEFAFQLKEKTPSDIPFWPTDQKFRDQLMALCQTSREMNDDGEGSWATVVLEELGEALETHTPESRLHEWSQVAVAALAALENIFRNEYLKRPLKGTKNE